MNSYPNYNDLARWEYGRMLSRAPDFRQRLINHWTDPRHPYRERFLEQRKLIELILTTPENEAELDAKLRTHGTSLRAAMREIPPVFGSFW